MNLKKVYRLYREEGLTVRRRGGRKRAIGTRAPLKAAVRPNAIWVLDFVSDMLETAGASASSTSRTSSPARGSA